MRLTTLLKQHGLVVNPTKRGKRKKMGKEYRRKNDLDKKESAAMPSRFSTTQSATVVQQRAPMP
jgi:hypothetical protein